MTSLDNVISDSPFLSFHRDLVQTESISGNEAQAGDLIVNFLVARNFTVEKQPVGKDNDSNRFNILAYSKNQQPKVLLTSHFDTVPPFIPYSLSRIDDDKNATDKNNIRIAGRGSVDAKASVAAQIFAALDVLETSPSAPIGLLFVIGEEVGGDGMQTFSCSSSFNPNPSPYHTFIFGEPTEHALVAGHKGMLGFDIRATGQAAHSGYPWLGRSAVSVILPALQRVDQLGEISFEDGGLPSSPKYGKTTVNIGHMEGGVAGNVVPASARADVAVRLAAGTPDEAREIIRRAINQATGDDEHVYPDFEARLEAYPPQDLDADVDGFNVITVNYGTDVPNLLVHPSRDGLPVKRYLYGPGTIFVAHSDHEALTVAQLEESVEGYKMLVEAALRR